MSNHKGLPILPTVVYHKSNPIFRDNIAVNGLLPMKGSSYACHSPADADPPAIFGSVNTDYDSTYDDDVYQIDVVQCTNEWFVDNEVHGGDCVVTYIAIPLNAITLIHKGTGKSSF
jgi:hypothetical protein